ncbi:MAG: signal recognition particle subunit SRP19/SEC65 family protein [Candidatus Poseidoniaceae archaeon]|nr:signal recognition particle subunit SRP19/SEC65 family protein [Candidatus Poseidoniaceae archaeon]
MDHNPDRIAVWPGYFNAKVSRRSGRRVPRDSSVLRPDLEGLFIAARALGLRKIKRDERISHPQRPHGKEGRLWVSKRGALESIGASSKEEILQLIGGQWRKMQKEQRDTEKEAAVRGPQTGDRRARAQRKGSNKAKAAQARAQRAQKQRRRR